LGESNDKAENSGRGGAAWRCDRDTRDRPAGNPRSPAPTRKIHPWANDYDYRYRRSGFWPGDIAAGVVAGAIGTADAIVSAPYRDSYAYYGSPAYDDSSTYYVERPLSRRPACGIQPRRDLYGPRWPLVPLLTKP